MIKFYFPRELSLLESFVPSERLKRDLIMVAEESDKIKGVCCFYYQEDQVTVNALISCQAQFELPVLDGLFRSVLFHTAALDCTKVKVMQYPKEMDNYFLKLGFDRENGVLYCGDYPKTLFSGCADCKKYKQ